MPLQYRCASLVCILDAIVKGHSRIIGASWIETLVGTALDIYLLLVFKSFLKRQLGFPGGAVIFCALVVFASLPGAQAIDYVVRADGIPAGWGYVLLGGEVLYALGYLTLDCTLRRWHAGGSAVRLSQVYCELRALSFLLTYVIGHFAVLFAIAAQAELAFLFNWRLAKSGQGCNSDNR